MAATTYLSLLQWRMEEHRLMANGHFKAGSLGTAVDLYLNASRLFDAHNTKPNNDQLLLITAECPFPDSSASTGDGAAPSPAVAPANMAASASPAAVRSALLEELTKAVGNACTSLYKLGRYAECAAVAKRNGIDRNPYFAKGHAFVGMSNINLIREGLFADAAVSASLTADERAVACQRLHEACQRLFTAMLILPAMAGQVKASLAEGLRYLKTLQQQQQQNNENDNEDTNAAAATRTACEAGLIAVTKSTAGHGHGVVATESLPAGALLARLSHPFSVAAYDGFHRHSCVACGIPLSVDEAAAEVADAGCDADAGATKDTKEREKKLGCNACRRVRYCSAACQSRYHVPRHLLHECAYMLKLKIMCENIAEKDIDVPEEFSELAAHAITTLSGLLVLKASPLAFFDPTNAALAAEMERQRDTNKQQSNSNDSTNANAEEETIVMKAYKIRKSLLALEAHSVEVAQSMHPTLPLLCEVFSIDTMGDRGAVSALSGPPTSAVTNNSALPELDEHLVATLIGIVRCNSMEIADPSGLGVAQGLFAVPAPYLSLFPSSSTLATTAGAAAFDPKAIPLSPCHFNHSCDPNAAFDVKAQEIRAISPIPKGTDITISYIPQLYWPSSLRTDGLAERFYFKCSCDRCSPYRRAAVAEQKKKDAAAAKKAAGVTSDEAEAAPSAIAALLAATEDVEVSSIYDKISAAEKPIAAAERPGATRYYYNNMLGVCGGIRQRPVEEIIAAQTTTTTEREAADGSVTTTESATPVPAAASAVSADANPLVAEVAALAKQCSAHLEPWHYVLHDVHNTQTFLFSVLGDHGRALVSSLEELLTFEACVAGAVPAKVDKLRNIMACTEGLPAGTDASAVVAGCASAHKEVLAALVADEGAILSLLLDVHASAPAI